MFIVTITSSVVMILVAVLVLLGLHISRDTTEPTKYIKQSIWITVMALAMTVIAYGICLAYAHEGIRSDVYRVGFYLRDLPYMTITPLSLILTKYIAALGNHQSTLEKVVNEVHGKIRTVGYGLSAVLIFYIVMSVLGINDKIIYLACAAISSVLIIWICVLVGWVIVNSKTVLGTLRTNCFAVSILLEMASVFIYINTGESLFFTVCMMHSVFLLLAMQTDRVRMSNVETVSKALVRAEMMNSQLQESLRTVEEGQRLLKEVSNVYMTLHVVNVKENTYAEIGSIPDKAASILHTDKKKTDNQELLWEIMKRFTNPSFTEEALEFTNFRTLSKRMKGKKSLAFEAIDDEDRWVRFMFIRVGDNLNEDISEVIFATENIDVTRREWDRLQKVSYVDKLTDVFNKNAYLEVCDTYLKEGIPDRLWIMVTDINGLKYENDTKGHDAGDELIKGVASCLKRAVGTSGKIYRNGGDEFITIVEGDNKVFADIVKNLKKYAKEWETISKNELRFSIGFVSSEEFPQKGFHELANMADLRMYEEKKKFYRSHKKMDRRLVSDTEGTE